MTAERPTVVYVYLLDEGVNVWRPVDAIHLEGSTYQLLQQPIPDGENWEFAPGTAVECRMRELSEGPALVATAKAASQ